jgi:predicted ABC-type transport system involved in lysophospholipase L1 biosynthesis ATPase subunit
MSEPTAIPPVLEADGLHKRYRSGHRDIHVLRGATLSLHKGETVSIRGESGSGKSTLLNLLAGIETPDGGDVSWEGAPLAGVPESRRPRLRAAFLGFVFQAFYLVPELDALANVMLAARIAGMPPSKARARAEQLLGELGLSERLRSRPEQLSGGERQRAAIARALINRPRVLLADEPTGNLDEQTAARVMDQLLHVVKSHDTALVLVTHHAGFAARTGRRYRLVEGVLEPVTA